MGIPLKATSSTLGEIILGGDFTGPADAPSLIKSGVVSGVYALTKRVSIDNKGRVTSIGKMTQAEIDAAIDAGYTASPSDFTIVSGRPVLNTPPASTSSRGLVKINGGIFGPTNASTSIFGVVKVGSGTTILTDGVGMPSLTQQGSFILGSGTDFQTVLWMSFATRHAVITSNTITSAVGALKGYFSADLTGAGTWAQSTATGFNGDNMYVASDGVSKAVITTGTDNCYVTNDSGQTWSIISGLVNQNIRSVGWNGTHFCIAGYSLSGTYSVVTQTSTDGVTWAAGVTLASGIVSQPNVLVSRNGAGNNFAITVTVSSTRTLYTASGAASSWTTRGTTAASDNVFYFGLANGKLLRSWTNVLQVSSDFVNWTDLYRTISAGGAQPNDWARYIPSFTVGYNAQGYMVNNYGFFATDGVTIGSKITEHGFSVNRMLEDPSYVYVQMPGPIAGGSQSGIMYCAPKADFSFTTYSSIVRAGLGVDFSSLIPQAGGVITSGTLVPSNEQVLTKSLIAASTAWSTNSGGVDISAGNDSVLLNMSGYVSAARSNAAASSGSRVVQVFIGPSSDWFTSYTDDGSTWVTTKIATPTGASPRLVGMEYLASASKFVMIGKQTSAVESQNWTAYSSDGISWTFNFSPWTSTAYITSSLSLGFSGVIATGRSSANLCSVRTTDGISWALSITGLTPSVAMACTCMDTLAGHTAAMWTMCGVTGASATAVYYSTNGTSWTVVANAVSGTGGGIFAPSPDGPCMILTNTGVVYTGRFNSSGGAVVNLIFLSGGSGFNGYSLTMGGDSSTIPSMLLADPTNEFYATRGTSVQRYGTSAAIGNGNATYPLLLGSTYVYPAFGSNMPGRAGGGSPSLSGAATANNLPNTTANKTFVNGPTQELSLRGASEVAGSIHQITVSNGAIVPISIGASTTDNCLEPGGIAINVPRSSRLSLTSLRTSDSKWLFFGD